MKTYKVWFKDNSWSLVTACNEEEAIKEAGTYRGNGYVMAKHVIIERIEEVNP